MNTITCAFPVEELIARLGHADQVIRLHAATLLGALGAEASRAVPALVGLLQGKELQDRRMAALTLGEIGPAAAAALPALLNAADSDDEGVAGLAIWALEEIDLPAALEEAA